MSLSAEYSSSSISLSKIEFKRKKNLARIFELLLIIYNFSYNPTDFYKCWPQFNLYLFFNQSSAHLFEFNQIASQQLKIKQNTFWRGEKKNSYRNARDKYSLS